MSRNTSREFSLFMRMNPKIDLDPSSYAEAIRRSIHGVTADAKGDVIRIMGRKLTFYPNAYQVLLKMGYTPHELGANIDFAPAVLSAFNKPDEGVIITRRAIFSLSIGNHTVWNNPDNKSANDQDYHRSLVASENMKASIQSAW